MLNQVNLLVNKVCSEIRKNFRSVTFNFIFIFIFINLFQFLFGAENSIVAIVFIIVMQSSMLLDFTIKPVKNFFAQLLVLEAMAISAFLINNLNPFVTIPMNFIVLVVLLYAFTFEYTTDLYMPYILSYLFLVFISPVSLEQLPKRMLAILAGTVCVILYHLFEGRNRTGKTVCEALTKMIDEASQCTQCLLSGVGLPDSLEAVRSNLYQLSHLVYERRKRFFYISDASSAMLDCGLKLENLIRILYHYEGVVTPEEATILEKAGEWLNSFRAVIQDGGTIELPNRQYFLLGRYDFGENVYKSLEGMQNDLVHMMDFRRRSTFQPTLLSWTVKIKSVFHASPVRIVYSLRVAALLSVLTALVLFFQLPHGKWLLFTVAAVSLPYADDVGEKAKKRFLATLLGGCICVLGFLVVPGMLGRTILMMFFGYLTAYFTDYRFRFACSTVGGLGGAMLVESFGLMDLSGMFAIRLGYICMGIAVAYVANRFIYPFHRSTAIKHLCKRHFAITELLEDTLHNKSTEPQLYYNLMVHTLLQEEKLKDSMDSKGWHKMKKALVHH